MVFSFNFTIFAVNFSGAWFLSQLKRVSETQIRASLRALLSACPGARRGSLWRRRPGKQSFENKEIVPLKSGTPSNDCNFNPKRVYFISPPEVG
jgi:hypothetical protein